MNTIQKTKEEKLKLKKAKSAHKVLVARPDYSIIQAKFFRNFVMETKANDKGKSYERPRTMPNWNSLNVVMI